MSSVAASNSAGFDSLIDLANSVRFELTFLATFLAAWVTCRLFGVRLQELVGFRRVPRKTVPAPFTPSAGTKVSEGSASWRRGLQFRSAATAQTGADQRLYKDLKKPSEENLVSARWVLAAVQQLTRAQDQQEALEIYRKARKAGLKLDTYSKADGHLLFMLLVTAAIRIHRTDEALSLLRDCRREGPGIVLPLVVSTTKLATGGQHFKECLEMFDFACEDESLIINDRCVWSCLLFCALESQSGKNVPTFWEKLKSCGDPSYKDFGNMMRFASLQNDWELALQLLQDMKKGEYQVERVIFNTALATCVTAGQLDHAWTLLERMEAENGLTDVITYNTLAKGFAKAGELETCFQLCGRLRTNGLQPSQVTYGILLDCCINLDRMDRAQDVFDHMVREGCQMNTVLYTTMIKGFSRAGRVDEAMKVYEQMRSNESGKVSPDIITFSVLIKANCDNGRLKVALGLLDAMMDLKLEPDEVIFNNLIGGCVHEINTTLAKRLYNNMVEGGIKPSTATFSILIRLFCAAKQIDEAVNLLQTEPSRRGVDAASRLHLQLIQCCLRDRQGRKVIQVYKMMPETPTTAIHSQILGSCTKLNMLETGVELLALAVERGAVISKSDIKQLRDMSIRKKKPLCTDMIDHAAEAARLV